MVCSGEMRKTTAALVALITACAAHAQPLPLGLTRPVPVETEIVILLAGDTGLNASFKPVYAGHAYKGGERLQWPEATGSIAQELTGDVNFANLETVVTDRNDIEPHLKRFSFRTHPDAVRHLKATGINLFSTANNHTMDFGLKGARETLKHLEFIGAAHAGLGADRAAARTPRLLDAKQRRIALGAVGIIGNAYASPAEDEDRPGQLSYTAPRDFNEAVAALATVDADIRMLSVHYGQEFEVSTNASDRKRLADAVAKGIDLVAGHHHHVVAGIELVDGAPIFYGLGNFLHWGTQDMARFDICRDYGLIARVHYAAVGRDRPKLRAIEAIPITGMHKRPRRMAPDDAKARLHVLNHLAGQFGDRGVRFAAEPDGTGLYCAQGVEQSAGSIGSRCRNAVAVAPPPKKLASEIKSACAQRVVRVVENEDGLEPEFAPVAYEEPALHR